MNTFEVAITSKQGVIDFSNYEQLKQELELNLAKFDNLVVDKEGLAEYKGIRANLNKVSDLLDKERKRIKKSYSEPLLEFENKAKVLVKLVDDITDKIDCQIKKHEFEQKKEKKTSIEVLYCEIQTEVENSGLIAFELIFQEEWLNAGFTFPKIKKAILDKLESVKNDIFILGHTDVEDTQLLISFYLESLSMSSAINAYKAHTERFAKAQQIMPTKQEHSSERTESALKSNTEESMTVSFTVTSLVSKLQALSDYMHEHNIVFKKL